MKKQNEYIARLENLYKTFEVDIRGKENSLNWLALKNPQWEAVPIPLISLQGSIAPPLRSISGSNVLVRSFKGIGSPQDLSGTITIPPDYAEGTDIYLGVLWFPEVGGITANIKWNIQYFSEQWGATLTTFQTISVVASTLKAAWTQDVALFPAISGTGFTIYREFPFSFFRDPGDVQDTYTQYAGAIKLFLFYESNTFGARVQFIK